MPTLQMMRKSIFCVCPPGKSSWTARLYNAIASGCIPVTFYRAVDQPWQQRLGMDYSRFTVNIPPDEIHKMPAIVESILENATATRTLQQRVLRVRSRLLWTQPQPSALRERSEKVTALNFLWRELDLAVERFSSHLNTS